MKRKVIVLLCIILSAVFAYAQEDAVGDELVIENFELYLPGYQELPDVFPLFLAKLAQRHEDVKTLAMPNVEALTAPGFEDEAVYMAAFKTPQDARIFLSAIRKENIPTLTFPNDELRIGLFHSDLLIFLMKAAIGL
jgi:hypothetical protein